MGLNENPLPHREHCGECPCSLDWSPQRGQARAVMAVAREGVAVPNRATVKVISKAFSRIYDSKENEARAENQPVSFHAFRL